MSNVLVFFHRSCSIYSRMAVTPEVVPGPDPSLKEPLEDFGRLTLIQDLRSLDEPRSKLLL